VTVGAVRTAAAALVAIMLSGCLQPRDAIVFEIGGKREFRNAVLLPPSSAEHRAPIRLRFLDTNTFMTTATLVPGNYVFTAMTLDGIHLSREVKVEKDKRRYQIAELTFAVPAPKEGPTLTGGIYIESGEMPREVAVLFISSDIIIRRVPVNNGRFSANSPAEGTYRVEVHELKDPPRSWVRDGVKIEKPTDVGIISLK
jgi:hypothetical protein